MGIFSKIKDTIHIGKEDADEKNDKEKKKESSEKKDAKNVDTKDISEKKRTKKTKKAIEELQGSQAYKVLYAPIFTEKSDAMAQKGKYVFQVNPKANKIEIKKAVKDVYGVEVKKVNVMNYSGDYVRFGRSFGKKKDTRKAIVTVKDGQSIDLFA